MSARPSSCTSRSRTAPSSRASQPSSSRKTWARTGSTASNSERAARRRRVATRMSCSSSGSSPSRVPGSLALQHGELAPQHGEGDVPHGGRRRRRRSARGRASRGSPRPRASRPASNLERWAGWSPQDMRSCSTIGSSASSHSGWTSTSTRRSCMGRCPVPTTIMVSSSAISATSTPPTRSAKGRRRVRTWSTSCSRREPTMARSRRPTGPSAPEPVQSGRGEDLGDLQTLAQAASLGGTAVLERDLVVAAAAPGADDEAGAGDAPVVGVEIGVDQPPRRSGQRGHRPSVAGLDGEGRERGQPALDRPQVEGVELPLDLDGVVARPARLPWNRTSRSGYCGLPRPACTGRDCRGSAASATVTCDPVARRAMTAELPSQTDVVQAAGGLVVRRRSGLLEIVVVHRPVQQDWSFPKGKLEAGETLEIAALREVRGRDGHGLRPPPLHRPHRVRRPEGSAEGGGLLDHGGRSRGPSAPTRRSTSCAG